MAEKKEDIVEKIKKDPITARVLCSGHVNLDHVLTETTPDGQRVPLARRLPASARKYALTGVWAPKKGEKKQQDYQTEKPKKDYQG